MLFFVFFLIFIFDLPAFNIQTTDHKVVRLGDDFCKNSSVLRNLKELSEKKNTLFYNSDKALAIPFSFSELSVLCCFIELQEKEKIPNLNTLELNTLVNLSKIVNYFDYSSGFIDLNKIVKVLVTRFSLDSLLKVFDCNTILFPEDIKDIVIKNWKAENQFRFFSFFKESILKSCKEYPTENSAYALTFLPNSASLVVGSRHGDVFLVDLKTKIKQSIFKHILLVSSFCFYNNKLISGSYDGKVNFYDTSYKKISEFNCYCPVTCLSVKEDFLLVGASNGLVFLYDLSLNSNIKTFQVDGRVCSLFFLDKNVVRIGTSSNQIFDCNFKENNVPVLISKKQQKRESSIFYVDDKISISRAIDGNVSIHDFKKERCLHGFNSRNTPRLKCLDFIGNKAVVIGSENIVKIYSLDSYDELFSISLKGAYSISVSPDQKKLAIGFNNHRVKVYDIDILQYLKNKSLEELNSILNPSSCS